METESAKTLPRTFPGSVCEQWKRCGTTGCRCAKGNLHGPYFYRFWRQGGRLRKEYVPKALFDQVAVACEARREFQQELKASKQAARPAGRYSRGRITMTELTAANGSVTTEAGPLAGDMVRAVGEIITTYEKH